jgi:hypothetical protein
MKSDNKLRAIYDKAKGDKHYFSFESFKEDAREFLKDCRNRATVCHMEVSRSGMMRRFNFDKYNMLLNICYNKRATWDAVRVGGCGMDMHWYLKFTNCESLATKAECAKFDYNYASSSGRLL